MPVLSLAMQRKTGLYLTDNDKVGPAERATVFHYLEDDGLQKLVFDTLRSKGFDLIRVVPEADEKGYLRVAFFSEYKPVFFRIVYDELILSDEQGQLLEKRRGDALEKSFGPLPVTYLNATWRNKGFLFKEDEIAYKKEMGVE